jgi:murein DD-endopeptidase MepM/ murein hydrolase activator NlpD
MPEGRRTSRATGPRGRSSDHLPALGADERAGGPLDRRSAQTHRLIALILLSGAAAALMWGALYGALGTRAHFALAPPIFRRAEANASSRGNQLVTDSLGMASRLLRTRIEEIDEQAKTNKVFTHIVASLEGSSDPPALADAATTTSAERVSATAGLQALPSEILTGLSQAEAQMPAAARAYADVETPEIHSRTPLGRPLNLTTVAKSQSGIVNERRVVFARPGDTLRQVLSEAGMIAQDAQAVSPLLSPEPSGSDALTADDSIILTADDSNEQPFRPLKILVQRKGSPAQSVALADDGRYVRIAASQGKNDPALTDIIEKDGPALRPPDNRSLRESLDALAGSRRIDRSLIDELVRLCAHDVDLEAPVSRDASVELLYVEDRGEDPELAFAALTTDGHTHRYYRFAPPDGDVSDYYNSDGQAVTQFLLRKPVAAGRLGDGFGWRIHPILLDRRFHRGVDYAAPFGSPIVAAGAGVVEKIDQEWGYGKYVRVLHDFGYETTYAHISSVPRGLRVGARVHQGQTIAYVGSTGLSTGPHLYYEVRINGRDVDPLRIRLRAGRILDGKMLEAFSEARFHTDILLQASGTRVEGRR